MNVSPIIAVWVASTSLGPPTEVCGTLTLVLGFAAVLFMLSLLRRRVRDYDRRLPPETPDEGVLAIRFCPRCGHPLRPRRNDATTFGLLTST